MKAAIIAPMAMLDEYSARSDFQMALAHLVLKDSAYQDFYRMCSRAGQFVLMDNGVVETGKSFSIQDIFRAAALIEATEIVLPDVLNNGPATWAATTEALKWIFDRHELGHYRLLASPQGSSALEWLQGLYHFSRLGCIDTLGISKFTHPLVAGGRERLLEVMELLGLVDESAFQYHLLGISEDPLEVLRVRNAHPWVRSVDSCIPVLSGLHGVAFPDPMRMYNYERPAEDMNFWAVVDPTPEITGRNVDSMIAWAEGR